MGTIPSGPVSPRRCASDSGTAPLRQSTGPTGPAGPAGPAGPTPRRSCGGSSVVCDLHLGVVGQGTLGVESPVTSSAPPLAGVWPLVGRDRELAEIAAARADVGCHGIVVIAQAGMGKSRLAREAQASAQRDGALIEWVQATRSAATVPLAAFADLVPDEVRSEDTVALLRRCGEELRHRAAGRTVVLGVDDAQLLDPVSAALVLHLATSASAFILATVRAGEPCPDAIVSLWKDDAARRLELHALGDEDVRALVETALADPVEEGALRWVTDVSRGNALYVRELVRGAVDDGALVHGDGFWRMDGLPVANASLVELVGRRMAELTAGERELVELLAL